MARIAFCLPAMRGHLGAHAPLARELARRGHDCVLMGSRRLRPLAQGLPVQAMEWNEPDLGGAGLALTLWRTARATSGVIRHAPAALQALRPDLVVADQAEPGFALAAEAARVPWITLSAGLPLDGDASVPPPFLPWPHEDSDSARRRNRGGWRVSEALMVLQRRALAAGCRRHGLAPRPGAGGWISDRLDLRQIVPALDFPRDWPAHAVGLGPLRDAEPDGALPPELTGSDRPLVFASLGTLSGRRLRMLHAICAAAADLRVRLVLAHAGMLTEAEAAALPGRPLACALWPQRAVLEHVAVCVTHGGLNTTLDSAAAGVPMLAMPLAFEQPGIAARIEAHGLGLRLDARAAPDAIREALSQLLDAPRWRDSLSRAQQELRAAGGVRRGADLIEGVLAGARIHEAAE